MQQEQRKQQQLLLLPIKPVIDQSSITAQRNPLPSPPLPTELIYRNSIATLMFRNLAGHQF